MITRDIIWLKIMYFAPEIKAVLSEVANLDRINADDEIVEVREERSREAKNSSKLPSTVKVTFAENPAEKKMWPISIQKNLDRKQSQKE